MALGLESVARASPVSRRVTLDLTLVGAAAALVVATCAWGLALERRGVVILLAQAVGEVERIWLPLMPWLIVACALLPARHHRVWLAAQLVVGISVQTVVMSLW